MKIKINKNLVGVDGKAKAMVQNGQIALVNQVYADTNKYVPMLSGDMRNQSSISVDRKSIIYHVPYARRQYYNVRAKFTTAGTFAKWDVIAKAVHQREWVQLARRAMRK